MARPIWTGTLGFGLVSVPVGLYTATSDRAVHFHQLESGTAERIRYRRVNERTGDEVPSARIVKGVEVGDGAYVVVSDDELASVAPERSTTIEIADFVELSRIDPTFFDTTYYLAPRDDEAGRAYALLRAAMTQSARVGIALFVLRGRERVVAVRPGKDILALQTMFFAEEVRDPVQELPHLPRHIALGERELRTASLLVESLETEWDPARYNPTYRQALLELVERKRHGETVRTESPAAPRAQVVDLMEALDASLAASRRGGRRSPRTPAGDQSEARGRTGSTRSARATRAAPARRQGAPARRQGERAGRQGAPARRQGERAGRRGAPTQREGPRRRAS